MGELPLRQHVEMNGCNGGADTDWVSEPQEDQRPEVRYPSTNNPDSEERRYRVLSSLRAFFLAAMISLFGLFVLSAVGWGQVRFLNPTVTVLLLAASGIAGSAWIMVSPRPRRLALRAAIALVVAVIVLVGTATLIGHQPPDVSDYQWERDKRASIGTIHLHVLPKWGNFPIFRA